ncbi:hypothetical protein DNAM_580 [Pseudomonas phage BroderSalsa]|nr:hypothetical protein DNAM_580 [Pseudomonas phage BroderSalsa]
MHNRTFRIITVNGAADYEAYQMRPLASGGVALYDYHDKCVGIFPCIVSAELLPKSE